MNKDIERLQGTWQIVDLELEGQKSPAMGAKITIQGNRFITTGMGPQYEGNLEVDEAESPKIINMVFDVGPEKGNTSLGIYEIENDTWKICLTSRGNNRPKKFATEPGTGHACEVLKREKPAGGSPAGSAAAKERPTVAQADSPHLKLLEGEWKMVSGTLDGLPLDQQVVQQTKRVTRGNETTVYMGPQVYMNATFSVDPEATPKSIDYVHTQGPMKGQTQLGIDEVERDTLKISFAAPGQERPTDFTSKPGDGRTVTVWKRLKK